MAKFLALPRAHGRTIHRRRTWLDLLAASLSHRPLPPGANLPPEDQQREDLSVANLRGADLFRADLRGADLSWADLRGANLSWADLRGANLSGTNLSTANLSTANLSGARLTGANLREANLREANLSTANVTKADLREANLFGLVWSRDTRWPDRDFEAAMFRRSDEGEDGYLRVAGEPGGTREISSAPV